MQIKKVFCSAAQNSFQKCYTIPGLTDFCFIEFTDNGYLTSETSWLDYKEIVNTYNEL